MVIGENIKNLRHKMGLTQEELAERSELTKGFISQLERDLTSPSIDTLSNVLEALGTSLGEFFKTKKEEQIIFKKEDYFEGSYDKLGLKMEWIVPNAQKNSMEPVLFTFDKDGETKEYTPYEGEEFGYVLEGEIKLMVGNKEHVLKTGETFYLMPDESRYIKNNFNGKSKILWITNPPNF
ncbi:MAG: helix-turn-helix domain-containing protein [Tissierellia bacterium]|nr:helix-turn-helix domain-containing protein [Tissierellia bacterium]